jgi:hypothetical protein
VAKRQVAAPEPVTRVRRSEEVRIAELEAKIAALQRRAEAKKVRKDPALKHMGAALRSVDKALAESQDQATRTALDEIRSTLSACLSLNGSAPKDDRGALTPHRRPAATVDADAVLAYIQANPGAKGEHIAAALGTDTRMTRPVIHRLIDDGRLRTRGKARGMSYTAV